MLEQEETKKVELINELKKGEKSGFVKDFNRQSFLSNLNKNIQEVRHSERSEESHK